MSRRFFVKVISFIVILSLACSMFPTESLMAETKDVQTEENGGTNDRELIEIYTADEFLAFADNCHIDSWSLNRRIVLKEDIDLSGMEAPVIPVFAGTFDGEGHTISGFQCVGSGYIVGLFRYIQKDGLVENVTLKGNVTGTNEKECIGSLCGINYGTIRNCSFHGNVRGRDTVGGIAGINESTGTILGCTVQGRITGYYSTGGVAGTNHGVIDSCTNRAGVNDDSKWVEEDDEMGVGIFFSISMTDSDTELFSGVDTGGAAGYSDGMITRCTNYGKIGYEHAGYNIGGIAGRQAGVVSLCTNNGNVYGRKDVGGIVGQMEPYIEIDEAESLRNAVNKLHDLIDKTIRDMQEGKDTLKGDFDSLSAHGEAALASGNAMTGQMTAFADSNMGKVQEIVNRIGYISDQLPDILQNAANAQDAMNRFNQDIRNLLDELDAIEEELSETEAGDTVAAARDEMRNAADRMQSLSDEMSGSVARIRDILINEDGSVKDWGSIGRDGQDEVISEIVKLADALSDMSGEAASVLSSLSTVIRVMEPYGQDAWETVKRGLVQASEDAQKLIDELKAASDKVRGVINYVNSQPNIEFSRLGDGFNTTREQLHSELRGISDTLKSLSGNASAYSDVLNEDLIAVNDQLNVVFNILADHLVDYSDLSMEELYEEISDEDIETITMGKTDHCTNKGTVKGDINIGGIAGSMSVDDEDPEDNAAGSVGYGIGNRFITKCAIVSCVNEGFVTAKKNGAGGIAGYMRHGIVADCEGYGCVESTEGNYVGGICGESLTMIRRCYALGSVSGIRNVGGIAGYADSLKDCCAIVDCRASEGRCGAIAGQTASYENTVADVTGEAKVCRNYYVGDDMYGIDSISYVNIAEPVTYDELLTRENLPMEFRHLKVFYRIEDEELGTEEVQFGGSLANLHYPEIPEKEGYYGVWPDYSDRYMNGNIIVKGEYKENVTVVQSEDSVAADAAEGSARPYALVEQTFTEETVLKTGIGSGAPPSNAKGKEYVIYDIALENSGIGAKDTFPVRIYNPYKDAVVWGKSDGEWLRLDSRARGQYLQVDMTGPQESFCVVENKSVTWILIVAGVAILAAAAVAVALGKKVKAKRKGKKTGKKE